MADGRSWRRLRILRKGDSHASNDGRDCRNASSSSAIHGSGRGAGRYPDLPLRQFPHRLEPKREGAHAQEGPRREFQDDRVDAARRPGRCAAADPRQPGGGHQQRARGSSISRPRATRSTPSTATPAPSCCRRISAPRCRGSRFPANARTADRIWASTRRPRSIPRPTRSISSPTRRRTTCRSTASTRSILRRWRIRSRPQS